MALHKKICKKPTHITLQIHWGSPVIKKNLACHNWKENSLFLKTTYNIPYFSFLSYFPTKWIARSGSFAKLGYQPLFWKWASAPPSKSSRGNIPDSRQQRRVLIFANLVPRDFSFAWERGNCWARETQGKRPWERVWILPTQQNQKQKTFICNLSFSYSPSCALGNEAIWLGESGYWSFWEVACERSRLF